MILRPAIPADYPAITGMVRAAFLAEFGQSDEPALIDALRAAGDVVRETVAEEDGAPVGHILFSRAFIEGAGTRWPAVQLAPVCAARGVQKRGIGSALIRDGLEALRAAGETHVFLLGHPDYYPRFGFSAEVARDFNSPWPGPHFMLCRLREEGPNEGVLVVSKAFG